MFSIHFFHVHCSFLFPLISVFQFIFFYSHFLFHFFVFSRFLKQILEIITEKAYERCKKIRAIKNIRSAMRPVGMKKLPQVLHCAARTGTGTQAVY